MSGRVVPALMFTWHGTAVGLLGLANQALATTYGNIANMFVYFNFTTKLLVIKVKGQNMPAPSPTTRIHVTLQLDICAAAAVLHIMLFCQRKMGVCCNLRPTDVLRSILCHYAALLG